MASAKRGWVPVSVLPSVELANPIEGDLAALVPARDSRVSKLARDHATFGSFLHAFTDAFGVKVSPSVLLVHSDAPQQFFSIEAIASFRDLIAVATIANNRALEIRRPFGQRVSFGNAFEFYPWTIDKKYEELVCHTPALLGLHEVKRFQGQASAALPRMRLEAHSMDDALMSELLVRWRRRYESVKPTWPDIALFRSLNMAYHASMLPAGADTTVYDVGRLISLWVSAFEILVHPGGNGKANRDKVFDLIERVPWQSRGCADLRHDTGGKIRIKRTLGSWLYQQLYDRRCDFLHGNPVAPEDLLLPLSQRNIFQYAAPLYSAALVAFLPLTFSGKAPALSDSKAFGAYIAARMSFSERERTIEEALLTALQPRGMRQSRRAVLVRRPS